MAGTPSEEVRRCVRYRRHEKPMPGGWGLDSRLVVVQGGGSPCWIERMGIFDYGAGATHDGSLLQYLIRKYERQLIARKETSFQVTFIRLWCALSCRQVLIFRFPKPDIKTVHKWDVPTKEALWRRH